MVRSYRRGAPFVGSPVALIQHVHNPTATTYMLVARGIFACLATFVLRVIVYLPYSLQAIRRTPPTSQLLALHAVCARVARMSGAVEIYKSTTSRSAISKKQRFSPLMGHPLVCSTTLFPLLQQFLGLRDVLSWYLAVSCNPYVCPNFIHCPQPVCDDEGGSKVSGWS